MNRLRLFLVGLDLIWVGVVVGCIFFGLVKSYYMIMPESAGYLLYARCLRC